MDTMLILDGSVYAFHQQTLYIDALEVLYDRMLVDPNYLPSLLPALSDTGRILLFLLPLVDPGRYVLVTVGNRVYDMGTHRSVPMADVATLLSFNQVLHRTFI